MQNETITEPVLLKLPDAARLLSLGRSTVYELIEKGELPVVKIGRAVRVPMAALRDWAQRQEEFIAR